ncbi:MAG: RNA polymerase sigma factor [Cyanobacteria bacterium SZAS TMP-1]|nr:RNA polymerase sigma factor [Cyanobacteria bacterium SZAS TMP-1]
MRIAETVEIKDSFERTIVPFCGLVRRVALDVLRDHRFLDEVTQDVLLKAWLCLDRLSRREKQLTLWFVRTTTRRSIDYLRVAGRQLRLETFSGVPDDHITYCEDTRGIAEAAIVAEEAVVDPFVLAAVREFLVGLPERHRQVLLLSMAGLTYEEIAAATSANLGTVRSRLHYARSKARRALGHHL